MTDDLKEENGTLKAFLEWLFNQVFEGNPDGAEIQEKAEEMGILVKVKVPEDQRVNYEACLEYDTDEIYFPYWFDEAKGIFT